MLLLIAVSMAALIGVALAIQAHDAAKLRAVAERLDFRVLDGPAMWMGRVWRLQGRWRGFDASIRYSRALWTTRAHPRMVVEMGPVHTGVGIRVEGVADRVLGAKSDELQLGDPEFDRRTLLWGDEVLLRTMLHAPARAAVDAVMAYGHAEVSRGVVRLCEDVARTDLAGVGEMLNEAADLCDQLGPHTFHEERLLDVALEDPSPGVRVGALICLWRCGSSELVDLAVHAARAHVDPALRTVGALMSERRDLIVDIPAEALAPLASLAPAAVVRSVEVAGTEDQLFDLLDEDDLDVRRAAVMALGRSGSIRAVERLIPLTEGLTRDAELKRLARSAVDLVQERLGDVALGAVSLAEPSAEEGHVSLPHENGQVTLDLQAADMRSAAERSG